MEFTAIYDSPIGPLTLTFDGEALTSLTLLNSEFGTVVDDLVESIRNSELSGCGSHNSELRTPNSELSSDFRIWLDLYFSGQQPGFMPPIRLDGTDFQRRVWQALLEIPYGQTVSYGELARRIGCRSAQAVGQAVGRNPIAIIVPCHRVVGADGSLTGYAYGLEKKQYLLQLEKQHNSI